MRNIKILTIGKLKNQNLKNEVEELSKRINRFEIVELKDVKDNNVEIVKKKEFELIKPHLDKSNFNVLLMEQGKSYSTTEFYNFIKNKEQNICFIISGAYGPSSELKKEVSNHLSLSSMIFTHEQALYMLVEQIYRADCLEKGINYTK